MILQRFYSLILPNPSHMINISYMQGRRKQCEAAGAAIQKGTSFFWAAIFVTRLFVAIIISLHRAKGAK
jgi:hypothetical protein